MGIPKTRIKLILVIYCCERYHVLLGCYPVSISLFSHAFQSRLFLQVPPCRSDCTLSSWWPKADARDGAGGRRSGRGKRLFSPYFLLLFHPSEAQEVHPQTIWYLQICCESWGSARAQQHPPGLLGGPSPRLLSPSCRGTVSFTGFLIALLPARLLPGLHHLCCITVQNTIPALRQANCISFVSLAQLQKRHWN